MRRAATSAPPLAAWGVSARSIAARSAAASVAYASTRPGSPAPGTPVSTRSGARQPGRDQRTGACSGTQPRHDEPRSPSSRPADPRGSRRARLRRRRRHSAHAPGTPIARPQARLLRPLSSCSSRRLVQPAHASAQRRTPVQRASRAAAGRHPSREDPSAIAGMPRAPCAQPCRSAAGAEPRARLAQRVWTPVATGRPRAGARRLLGELRVLSSQRRHRDEHRQAQRPRGATVRVRVSAGPNDPSHASAASHPRSQQPFRHSSTGSHRTARSRRASHPHDGAGSRRRQRGFVSPPAAHHARRPTTQPKNTATQNTTALPAHNVRGRARSKPWPTPALRPTPAHAGLPVPAHKAAAAPPPRPTVSRSATPRPGPRRACARRSPCRPARRPCRPRRGPRRRTARPSNRGSDRNAAQPSAPSSPSPRAAWRSTLEPSSVFESLTCSEPSRSSPTTRSNSSSTSLSPSAVRMS